jgi:hypothetical protein
MPAGEQGAGAADALSALLADAFPLTHTRGASGSRPTPLMDN